MLNVVFLKALIIGCKHTVICNQKTGYKSDGQSHKQKDYNVFSKITF